MNGDEFFEPVDGAENAIHALIALRGHTGVLRMTGHANLVLVGDGDDALEEVRDALPEGVGVDHAGLCERSVGMCLGELPLVVHSIAAALHAAGTRSTPRMLMLYLMHGMPTCAQLRM